MVKIRTHIYILSLLLLSSAHVFADEVKIVFTGQSNAALYPCTCPTDPQGGVARRATLIKNIRSSSKNVVVIEAGSTFAASSSDQNAQNYELDSLRTDVYLRCLKEMGTDAILMESQEFTFGLDFLKSYQKMPLLSSNIAGFFPAVIKDFGNIKVGILGLTDELAVSKGALGWQAPETLLKARVGELKKKGVGVIIVLSALTPQKDKELAKSVGGIDFIVNGGSSFGSVVLTEENGVGFLSTWWQARKVSVLTLDISGSKIVKKTLEMIPLGAELSDDPSVLALVPQCFQDKDCVKISGSMPQCENGSTLAARCAYADQPKVSVTVIRPKFCRTCQTEVVIQKLEKLFSKLTIMDVFEDDAKAKPLMEEYKITMLPAYILDRSVEKTESFSSFSDFLEKGKSSYILKPDRAGVSYILDRKRMPKRLDVFYDDSYGKLFELFRVLKTLQAKHADMDVRINFLAVQDAEKGFLARGGLPQIEEFKRDACIAQMYPKQLFDYLICRSLQKGSSWWDECALESKIDTAKIKDCALTNKVTPMLAARTQLTQELKVASGPTFLVDNTEIFAIVNVPTLEELEKIIYSGN